MADTEGKPTITDPENDKEVRFTDNSAKESDFYPEDQFNKPLFLDPSGAPYALRGELNAYEIGQDEATDAQTLKDNEAWAASDKIGSYLEEDTDANS